jgi:hypothetical protein
MGHQPGKIGKGSKQRENKACFGGAEELELGLGCEAKTESSQVLRNKLPSFFLKFLALSKGDTKRLNDIPDPR